mgnify:CR=1 FL=1
MKVFIDGIGGYTGWNIANKIGKEHSLSGAFYAPREGEFSRRPSVSDDALVSSLSDDAAQQLLADADVIVIPALESLSTALDVLKKVTELQYEGSKTLICVSSVMTWARTQNTATLEESMFKTRKTSVKFQELKNFETIVLNCNSAKLHTVVVGSGIAYGNGENAIETFFRDAWLFPDEMLGIPLIGSHKGKNVLPMIHVADLASFVTSFVNPKYNLSDKQGLYALAVDDSRNTLIDVIAAVSSSLGCGKIRHLVDFEVQDLILDNPHVASSLQAHLQFNTQGTYLGGLGLEWHCRGGLVANIHKVSQEFIEYRGLTAPRVSVLAPPGLELDEIAQNLSAHYQVPLVSQKSITDEMLALAEEGEVEDPVVSDVVEYVAAASKSKKAPKPMTAEQVTNLFKWKLSQAECHNKGWIMVGFPNTAEEAELLSTDGKEDVGGGDGTDAGQVTYSVHPFHAPRKLITFDASDSDLEQRVTRLSDEQLTEKFTDVQSFHKELAVYRSAHASDGDSNSSESCHFLQTHCDIDPLQIRMHEPEVQDDAGDADSSGERPEPESIQSKRVIDMCQLYIENGQGKPFNYRPTRKERLELARKQKADAEAQEESKQLAEEEARRAETQSRKQEELQLEQRRNQYIRQEIKMLEKRALPLRQYLMSNVVPVLTQGLLEVCKLKPADPVDYLAEWLFRNNPEDAEDEAEAEAEVEAKAETEAETKIDVVPAAAEDRPADAVESAP